MRTLQLRRLFTAAAVMGLYLSVMSSVISPSLSDAVAVDPPLRMGVAYGDELIWEPDAELARSLNSAKELGLDWIRVDLSWADIQPESPDKYRWDRFDRVFNAASSRGLRVLAVVAYTPAWARSPGCNVQSCPPRSVTEFTRFARLAAERYVPKGLRNWEVWNEPNFTVFWYPKPDPAAYTELLKQTTRAIKGVDPTVKVIMGGLAAMTNEANNIPQIDFLFEVCRLGGCQVVDAIAFHPYTFPFLSSHEGTWRTSWNTMHGTRSLPADQFYSLRAVLNAYRLWGLSIWITEYGAPTGGPGAISDGSALSMSKPSTHVTEGRQAQTASDSIKTAMADPTIGAFIWYSEQDRSFSTDTTENFFGLRRADGSLKPAYTAFRDTLAVTRTLRSRG